MLQGIPAHIEAEMAAAAAANAAPAAPPATSSPAAPAPAPAAPAPAALAPALPASTPATQGARAAPQNLFVRVYSPILTVLLIIVILQAAAQAAQAAGATAGGGAVGGRLGGGAVPPDLQQLRDTPAFQQIRQLVQQNPAFIQPLMQQLAASNPQLGEHIRQHPETLLQLLGGELPIGEEGEGGIPPGAIQVTEEEHAAIQRVRAFFLIMIMSHYLLTALLLSFKDSDSRSKRL
jgi:UV excision repair protein RAD23